MIKDSHLLKKNDIQQAGSYDPLQTYHANGEVDGSALSTCLHLINNCGYELANAIDRSFPSHQRDAISGRPRQTPRYLEFKRQVLERLASNE